MASQITSLTIVYAAVYSGADQRKRDSSASLAFVREIHRWPVNSPHKWPVTRKMFPFDDVIMRLVPLLHCCIVVSQSINQGMFQIGENPVYLKQLPEHITDPYIFRTWFSNILSAIWGSGVCVCSVCVWVWVGGWGWGRGITKATSKSVQILSQKNARLVSNCSLYSIITLEMILPLSSDPLRPQRSGVYDVLRQSKSNSCKYSFTAFCKTYSSCGLSIQSFSIHCCYRK